MHETVTSPELSVAEGSDQLTTPVAALGEVTPFMPAGHCNTGGVMSCTITLKVQVAEFEEVSVAVQLTVVGPAVKVEPEG